MIERPARSSLPRRLRHWGYAALGLTLTALACGFLDLSVWTVAAVGVVVLALAVPVWFVVRRPRFTMRSVFAAVTLIGLMIGLPAHWLELSNRRYAREREAIRQLSEVRATFSWRPLLAEYPLLQPPNWLVRWLGWGRFHTITGVWLEASGAGADDGSLELVSQFYNLESLGIAGAPAVTPAGLVHIQSLKELRSLSLSQTGLSATSLESLSKLSNLEHFQFDFPVGDADLAIIARMGRLRELRLAKMPITDEGLRSVAELQRLRHLVLRGTPITDRGLEYLAGLDLRLLDVSDTQVTGQGLARLRSLRGLMAYNVQLKDEDLGGFHWDQSLIELGIGDTQVGDLGVEQIAKANPDLRFLDLQGTGVTNVSMVSVGQLADLEALQLARTRVTDEGLGHFSGGRSVWVMGIDSVTAHALAPRLGDWGEYHQMAIDQMLQKGRAAAPRREY